MSKNLAVCVAMNRVTKPVLVVGGGGVELVEGPAIPPVIVFCQVIA